MSYKEKQEKCFSDLVEMKTYNPDAEIIFMVNNGSISEDGERTLQVFDSVEMDVVIDYAGNLLIGYDEIFRFFDDEYINNNFDVEIDDDFNGFDDTDEIEKIFDVTTNMCIIVKTS